MNQLKFSIEGINGPLLLRFLVQHTCHTFRSFIGTGMVAGCGLGRVENLQGFG